MGEQMPVGRPGGVSRQKGARKNYRQGQGGAVQDTGKKIKVLFLCTGNSCRSQMAEGWARHLWPEKIAAYSAGTRPHGLDPLAVEVMKEAGVDISGQRSKPVEEIIGVPFDLVVTVCSHADENCPEIRSEERRVGKEGRSRW